MEFFARTATSISRCPFCGRFDSEAETMGCVSCEVLASRLRETLPPEVSVVDALDEFYNGPRAVKAALREIVGEVPK